MRTTFSFPKVLLAFFTFIFFMIIVRFIYTGKPAFIFLIWNLFLAWIPFVLSKQFKKINHLSLVKQGALFFVWLLFFPNALYIVTDLIHLDMQTKVPKWFDALLLFTAAVTAIIMALIALLRVEKFMATKFKKVPAIMIAIIFLSSFGVYLGRFLRWNSWDLVSNPLPLFASMSQRIIYPIQHVQTWSITCLFTILFYLLFITVKKLPDYINQAV